MKNDKKYGINLNKLTKVDFKNNEIQKKQNIRNLVKMNFNKRNYYYKYKLQYYQYY